jgi:hypothetical protein
VLKGQLRWQHIIRRKSANIIYSLEPRATSHFNKIGIYGNDVKAIRITERFGRANGRQPDQGCQILLGTIYQKLGEIYQNTTKLPNGPKLYQMDVKYSKGQ